MYSRISSAQRNAGKRQTCYKTVKKSSYTDNVNLNTLAADENMPHKSPRAKKELPLIHKELSWLAFNQRVLQEAADHTVPVIQRLRYLGIFSNNMDEFFRVRVADVRRLATFATGSEQDRYKKLLEQIQQKVIEQQHVFEETYEDVLAQLRKNRIFLINEKQLDQHQAEFVTQYFYSTIQPELEPVLLDDAFPLPELTDASIYLAIKLQCQGQPRFSLLEVPSERLGRFVQIHARTGQRGVVFIVLENIIRHNLPKVFHGVVPIEKAEAYTIKLTRDAELEIDEGITQSVLEKVLSSLKRRQKPIRFASFTTQKCRKIYCST